MDAHVSRQTDEQTNARTSVCSFTWSLTLWVSNSI